MEKDPNNSMNGTATMPSYFPCIKSSESHPLADWLYLKSVITSSPELRMMTETYRKRLAISKQFADPYKPEMPATRPVVSTPSVTTITLRRMAWSILAVQKARRMLTPATTTPIASESATRVASTRKASLPTLALQPRKHLWKTSSTVSSSTIPMPRF